MKKIFSPSVAEPKATKSKLEKTSAENERLRGPVPNTIYTEAYVATLAKFIYVWAWPMVNVHNRVAMFGQLKEPMYIGGVLPGAPINHMCMHGNDVLSFRI